MGVIFVDKPKGYTSFDVCYKLRKVLNTKKIGHTGTLDPNATGVLVVLYGKDVKGDQFLVGHDKKYIGTCMIGIKTDTLDIDGKIIEERKCEMPSCERIIDCFKKYVGKQLQYPPLTSAIKVKGKRLFEYQRNGEDIKIEPREIEIYSLELLQVNENEFSFICHVSSGTYIRSLLDDILKELNIIGTLKDLKRIAVGNVKIEDCDCLEDIINNKYHIHFLYDIMKDKFEVIRLDDCREIKIGKKMKFNSNSDMLLICDKLDNCIAVYEKDGEMYKSKRGLF